MITEVCQRWEGQRVRYRPAGETIAPALYDVAPIADDTTARRFVEEHHYSRAYPAARFRLGLYRAGRLVGVAVFSHPCSDKVLAPLPGAGLARTELGRFVLLDEVPGNGESWFLARCFSHLAERKIEGVVSFSDPVPRARADGSAFFKGHVGTIYQASNARYAGRSTARTLKILPDGTVMSDRTIQKIRARERGWEYAVRVLEEAGAPRLGDEDTRGWLRAALPAATRKLRHPGCHRYLFGIGTRAKRALPAGLPYPKVIPCLDP